jgi:hypothetical protein
VSSVSQGNVSWVVDRQSNGSVVWALRAYRDGQQIVLRGRSKTAVAARRQIASALTEIVVAGTDPS